MRCQSCGGYNITDYGDGVHWQCKDCNWIFLKEKKICNSYQLDLKGEEDEKT